MNLKLCLEAATACFLSLSIFRFLRSVFSVFRMRNLRNAHFCCSFYKKFNPVDIFLVGAIAICSCLVKIWVNFLELPYTFRLTFFPSKIRFPVGEIPFAIGDRNFFSFLHTKNFHDVLLLFFVNFYSGFICPKKSFILWELCFCRF